MLSWPFFLKKNGTRRKSPRRTIREFALEQHLRHPDPVRQICHLPDIPLRVELLPRRSTRTVTRASSTNSLSSTGTDASPSQSTTPPHPTFGSRKMRPEGRIPVTTIYFKASKQAITKLPTPGSCNRSESS